MEQRTAITNTSMTRKGMRIESRRYDGDGTPSSWDESTYDENGCQLTSVSYDEDGAVMWRWEYEYDTSGNKVKSLYYDDGEDTVVWLV